MRMAAAAFCLLSALSSAEARKPHCLLRVHLEANARDGDVFSSQLASPVTGRKVVIEKSATISERDVVAFTPYPGTNGSYGALFQLDDHGRLALDSLSVERRGTYLYVFVNGRAVAELQIDRRVSDGKLYVASGLTQNDLALMKKDWPASGQRKK